MDQVMQFVEPSRQFVKDSIRLVKRCTKPDRKGEFIHLASAARELLSLTSDLIMFCLTTPFIFLNHLTRVVSHFRIPEDCNGHSDRVCHYGVHWFLRQTHSHPHQQYHCVSISHTNCLIIQSYIYTNTCLFVHHL